jgi:hypothetical protein
MAPVSSCLFLIQTAWGTTLWTLPRVTLSRGLRVTAIVVGLVARQVMFAQRATLREVTPPPSGSNHSKI